MCIVHKMNVVVTRSSFEAARSEVVVSEAIFAEIIYNIYIGLYCLESQQKIPF